MTLPVLAFYVFSTVAVVSAFLVVMARNPVHSVLWLILTFFSAAALFVLMGAEFVAMLLAIVYVGAVAVLFLFVVMMLDVDFAELKAGFSEYGPVGVLIVVILMVELGFVYGTWQYADDARNLRQTVTPDANEVHNTEALGQVIYTDYIYMFQASGLILLVAMIGAIVLTMRHRENIKRQDASQQMYRDPANALAMKDVKPGQGL
ncbi:MAG: NADH-quinone oxidoreductase subunit J [Pseudomonadota bacterium]